MNTGICDCGRLRQISFQVATAVLEHRLPPYLCARNKQRCMSGLWECNTIRTGNIESVKEAVNW